MVGCSDSDSHSINQPDLSSSSFLSSQSIVSQVSNGSMSHSSSDMSHLSTAEFTSSSSISGLSSMDTVQTIKDGTQWNTIDAPDDYVRDCFFQNYPELSAKCSADSPECIDHQFSLLKDVGVVPNIQCSSDVSLHSTGDPGAVTIVYPANTSNGIPHDTVSLIWQQSTITAVYDVYLDTVYPPVRRILSAHTDTSNTVIDLEPATIYYWQINSDDASTITIGDINTFTTSALVNEAPYWGKANVLEMVKGELFTYRLNLIDVDGDSLDFDFDGDSDEYPYVTKEDDGYYLHWDVDTYEENELEFTITARDTGSPSKSSSYNLFAQCNYRPLFFAPVTAEVIYGDQLVIAVKTLRPQSHVKLLDTLTRDRVLYIVDDGREEHLRLALIDAPEGVELTLDENKRASIVLSSNSVTLGGHTLMVQVIDSGVPQFIDTVHIDFTVLSAVDLEPCTTLQCDEAVIQSIENSYPELRVTANELEGRIKKVTLYSGDVWFTEVPKELFKLVDLRTVSFRGVHIDDYAADQIVKYDSLESFYFYSNEDTVQVPDVVFELTSLTSLEIHIDGSKKIKDLFGSLTKLTSLNLSTESQQVPPSIFSIPGLTTLNLSNSAMRSLPPEIRNGKTIERFRLDGCAFLNELPPEIGGMKALRLLIINSSIMTSIPDEMAALDSLSGLHLTMPLVELAAALGKMEGLDTLTIRSDDFTSISPDFGRAPTLSYLSLEVSGHVITLPEELGDITTLKKLIIEPYSIKSQGARLMTIPASLYNLTQLEHLSIIKVGLDSLPHGISALSNLHTLDLEKNGLQYLPDDIGDLDAIESINVMNNILKELPSGLKNHATLTTLGVWQNRICVEEDEEMGWYHLISTVHWDSQICP